MGAPAAVAGDKITGLCVGHQIPGPPVGNPVPAPPLPFAAPITTGLAPSVLIAGKPAVVLGSGGVCLPPHVGLHATDPFMVPLMQRGTVTSGSSTVLFENKPAATAMSTGTMCMGPAQAVMATAVTVLIG